VSDDIDVAAVLADPDGVLERLRASERDLDAVLARVRARIEVAGRLVEAAGAWVALGPGVPQAFTGPLADGPVTVADGGVPGEVSCREAVLGLLGQDPDRVWRAVDVAAVLGIDKIDSLRATMAAMAKDGRLVKVGPATYRAGADAGGSSPSVSAAS
jgi:hypothetical protein